ncbi:TPR repeat region-containing protein [Mycolicibacterium lacusdiani]|uniref:TPR repeat region-containing protein n=1 Tax=Mycolicibacterium lacusdiani TaxID=2895283 RepID=UPI001F42AC2E|nr:EspA/EspE family type VII secretion system effector [Mycolicibacterium lacusdiani]
MGVIDGFDATWSQARQTYGEGTPTTGEKFDQSSTLNNLKSTMDGAAPGSRWSGGASEAYGAANTEHQRVIGAIGDLDKQLGTQVTNAANLVNSGRNDLDSVKKWVHDAAATTQNNQAGERMKMTIVSKGLGQLTEVINNTDGQMQKVKGEIDKIKGEYQALGTGQKFAQEGKGDEDPLGEEKSDEEKKDEEEEKSPAEQGKADSEALQNGTLTDEQRERIETNTQISDDQKAALNNGTATMPPEQMSYLQNFSREFGDKTPAEIKAVMDKNGATGNRVADAMQLASNPNIKTGLPETVPPSLDNPASGGKHALPDGVQQVLDGPVLTPLEYGPPVKNPDGSMGPPELIGASTPVSGLNDLADVVQRGDSSLQKGTDLDAGLFRQSERLLEQSNGWAVPGNDLESDRPRWHHTLVDPTLQNMFNAVNKDDMVIHEALVGTPQTGPFGEQTVLSPQGERFLDNLTQHQWQDDGLAAGGLFDWVSDTAANDSTGRAAQTAHALAEFTSGHSPQLLSLAGADGQSLGEVNPELTRDMARAFAPYYDDMVGKNFGGNDGLFSPLDPDGSAAQPSNTRQLMSVLFSDQPPHDQALGATGPKTASEILFDSSKGYIDQAFEQTAVSVADPRISDDDTAMRSAAKLQAALDLGSYDEASDRMGETFDAKHQSWELRSRLLDMSLYGAGLLPGGEPVSDAIGLGKDVLIGPEPVRDTPPNLSLPDTFPIQRQMAEALANAQYGDPSGLQPYLRDGDLIAPPQTGDRAYDDYQLAVKAYMGSLDPQGKTNDLINDYWTMYSAAVVGSYPQK